MSRLRATTSESTVFEQNIEALHCLPARHLALPEINVVLERFVLGLPPDDPRKAARFEAMAACRHFDANHRIAANSTASIGCSGMPSQTQRPVEFAVCQFLASHASPAWAQAIARMAVNPRFEGAFQRPLLFTTIVVMEAADGSGLGCEPIVHHLHTPAFATTFLIQEARGFEPVVQAEMLRLARQIELRMGDEARAQAAAEQFLLRPLGEQAQAAVDAIRGRLLARVPISIAF